LVVTASLLLLQVYVVVFFCAAISQDPHSQSAIQVHVSPLCLGGMSLGTKDAWAAGGWGHITKEKSFELLDAFYEAGGNFIDTACN
jgi:aryl-alcohol dehydrogenase-like predicted oxidoreductase